MEAPLSGADCSPGPGTPHSRRWPRRGSRGRADGPRPLATPGPLRLFPGVVPACLPALATRGLGGPPPLMALLCCALPPAQPRVSASTSARRGSWRDVLYPKGRRMERRTAAGTESP